MPRSPLPIKPRILVIERDIEIQKRIAYRLEEGYTIDLTSSGSLALLLMKDYRYACIVASTELPNRHYGRGILEAVRSMPGGRYVPVIATISGDAEFERDVLEGFVTCLTLPAEVERLESAIAEVLEAWD